MYSQHTTLDNNGFSDLWLLNTKYFDIFEVQMYSVVSYKIWENIHDLKF